VNGEGTLSQRAVQGPSKDPWRQNSENHRSYLRQSPNSAYSVNHPFIALLNPALFLTTTALLQRTTVFVLTSSSDPFREETQCLQYSDMRPEFQAVQSGSTPTYVSRDCVQLSPYFHTFGRYPPNLVCWRLHLLFLFSTAFRLHWVFFSL